MLEQLMGLQLTGDKKINAEIKNLQSTQDDGVFAMLLSSQLVSKQNIQQQSQENTKDTKQQVKGFDLQNKNLSQELLSTINSKIDTLKNIQNNSELTALNTKANINLQNIYSELKTKKEFEGIRSVEELVKVANKSGLNLQNLTIETMEEAIKNRQDKKVSINDLMQSASATKAKVEEKAIPQEVIDKNKIEATKERLDTLKKVIDKNTQIENEKISQIKENLPDIGQMGMHINKKDIINNQDYKKDVVKDFHDQIDKFTTHQQGIEHTKLQDIVSQNQEEVKSPQKTKENKAPKDIQNTESGILNANAKSVSDTVELDKSKTTTKDEAKKEDIKKDGINAQHKDLLNSIIKNSLDMAQDRQDFSLNSLLNQINEAKTNEVVEKTLKKLDESFSAIKKEVVDETIKQEQKIELNTNKLDTKEIVAKSVQAKETVKKFVSDLEQKLQDYKPPLMKIDLELRPLNLGTVDVTIIARGSTLSIQMSSNPQALQMFMQNQDDFKNALAQIGFENVKMDFNSNSGGNSQSGNNQNSNGNRNKGYYTQNEDLTLENKLESINITIPKYI